MAEQEKRAPGLRFDRKGRPMWRASKAASRAGYPVKTVNLSELADSPILLRQRCIRLQQEMLEWLADGNRNAPRFDGTFGSLFAIYQTDPESSYFSLKSSSRKPYDVYLPMLAAEIGHCHIDRTDGTDLKRWFRFWSTPVPPRLKRTVAKARMLIYIIKAAITFGVQKRLPGCAAFHAILDVTEFEGLKPREQFIEAPLVTGARQAAHDLGEPMAALCYAIQFEGAIRQWDVRGQWLPLSDKQPSSVIHKGEKWIGPTWANVDANLILRWTPTKTENTSGVEIVIDFKVCPMVMEELALVPAGARKGPLITRVKTGRPYSRREFEELWSKVRKAAGIPSDVWNRDLRASGTTEARAAGAAIDDTKKVMGHSPRSQTASKVYDRSKLEAHRRIAAARQTLRNEK
jgi:hypothetical protein